MTNMDEIMHRAYLTARSFPGMIPPAGSMYIGSRVANGDWYRYWMKDGIFYQESSGEAELKRKLKRAGQ